MGMVVVCTNPSVTQRLGSAQTESALATASGIGMEQAAKVHGCRAVPKCWRSSPIVLDGLRFNVYDAGEFLMFKHPEHTAEIHMLTRMAHPHISATAGIAIKNKDTTIVLETAALRKW